MPKKKILMLNYEFPPLGGGGGYAAYQLAKGFVKKGYEVHYLTSNFNNEWKKEETVDGIRVFRVRICGRKELKSASTISMFTYLVTGFFKGIQLCRLNKYEFINTQFVVPTGPLGFVLSKLFGLKNIISLHGGDIYDPSLKRSPHRSLFFRKVITFLLNRADVVVAQSSNTKENTLKYYSPKKDVHIIPLPYEMAKFKKKSRKEMGLEEGKKYLISVGRLVKRKDYGTFIKAVSKIKDKNVIGLIVSDGPERDYLENLIRELKLKDRFKLLGYVDSEEEKFQYLACADIFVLTSLHEGFGIVIQEAMQVGLPVVSTNYGGQVDLIDDGVNGFLVEVGKPEKVAKKVDMLLKNNKLLKEFSKENLKRVNNYSVEKIANEYIDLFIDV